MKRILMLTMVTVIFSLATQKANAQWWNWSSKQKKYAITTVFCPAGAAILGIFELHTGWSIFKLETFENYSINGYLRYNGLRAGDFITSITNEDGSPLEPDEYAAVMLELSAPIMEFEPI